MGFPLKLKKKKIALVLGSGGARGFAHMGVINILEKEKIPIDIVVGTSIGALVGGIYCANRLPEFQQAMLEISPKQIFKLFIPKSSLKIEIRALFNLILKKHKLIKGKNIDSFLKYFIKNKKIENLNKKFEAIATDIVTGKEVVLNKGPLLKAIKASIAIPDLFDPVKYKDKLLIDGGVIDPIAIQVAKKYADIIIAVNVHPGIKKKGYRKTPALYEILIRSFSIMEERILELGSKEADIVISPDVTNIKLLDFHKAKRAISAGEKAAIKALPRIRKAITPKTIKGFAKSIEKKIEKKIEKESSKFLRELYGEK